MDTDKKTAGKDLYSIIKEHQVPCPWGDLNLYEGMVNEVGGIPGFERIPVIPLALVFGCGDFPMIQAYYSLARANRFGQMIFTDIIPPPCMGDDYLYLDLDDPDNLSLGGYRVHAALSIGVFTDGSCGVQFSDPHHELGAVRAISDLLMPGGIVANDNLSSFSSRFERLLQEDQGFRKVHEEYGSIMLQKPF